MEEDIKILEEWVEENRDWYCIECGYNCELNGTKTKHNQAIENLINKYKEQEKIIELMAKDIVELTGSCPYDWQNYEREVCENICSYVNQNHEEYKCFIEYYEKKAKGE